MALVKAWLKSKGFWLYSPSSSMTPAEDNVVKKVITHVFLDGGKACIPREHLPSFFDVCYSAIVSGDSSLCLVERLAASQGHFRMFMDVDVKSQVLDSRTLSHKILDALPTDLDVGRIIVCQRRGTDDNDHKQGLHLIWEDLVVTSEMAISMLRTTTSNLYCLFPEASIEWCSVLDASVYKNSGLRLVYCHKNHADHSFYEPWFISSPGVGQMARVCIDIVDPSQDILTWLRRCSIIPEDPSARAAGVMQHHSSSLAPYGEQCEEELVGGDLRSAIDALLATTSVYKGCIWTLSRISDQCFIVRLESKYCHNIKREHRNNHVYLIVTRAGVFQACHCRCPHHTCATYRKMLAGRGNAVSALLFPGKALKRIDVAVRDLSTGVASICDRLLKQRFTPCS